MTYSKHEAWHYFCTCNSFYSTKQLQVLLSYLFQTNRGDALFRDGNMLVYSVHQMSVHCIYSLQDIALFSM